MGRSAVVTVSLVAMMTTWSFAEDGSAPNPNKATVIDLRNQTDPKVLDPDVAQDQHIDASKTVLPRLLNPGVRVKTPRTARNQKGAVLIDCRLDVDGGQHDCSVVESTGMPALDRAAIDFEVRRRFAPLMVDGTPRAALVRRKVTFVGCVNCS